MELKPGDKIFYIDANDSTIVEDVIECVMTQEYKDGRKIVHVRAESSKRVLYSEACHHTRQELLDYILSNSK